MHFRQIIIYQGCLVNDKGKILAEDLADIQYITALNTSNFLNKQIIFYLGKILMFVYGRGWGWGEERDFIEEKHIWIHEK